MCSLGIWSISSAYVGGTGADTGKHSGVVMLGTLGRTTRIDSTVIGDAVNLASDRNGQFVMVLDIDKIFAAAGEVDLME
jgi:hypothetical protein